MSCPDLVALVLQGCSMVLLLSPCSPSHLTHPGREILQESEFPLGLNSRDILPSLMWNLDVPFGCWCWKLHCGDLCPWDSPTSHRDAPNTCLCVWWQQRLMVKNGNIWETGTVLMENGQAWKRKEGVICGWAFPEVLDIVLKLPRLLWSGTENCNEKDTLTLLLSWSKQATAECA